MALTEAGRARLSAAVRAIWADPETRARRCAAVRAAMADPEVRAAWLPKLRAANQGPAAAARNARNSKKKWENPTTRAAALAHCRRIAPMGGHRSRDAAPEWTPPEFLTDFYAFQRLYGRVRAEQAVRALMAEADGSDG